MEQIEEIEMQLWEFIDGTCTGAEKEHIAQLIANDAVWQEKFDELTALQEVIAARMELEQPSMRFSKNVMEAVSHVKIAPATKKYINYNIIKAIAAFFILAIAGTLGYAVFTANWQSTPSAPTLLPGLTKFNFTGLFDSNFFNIVIAVNVILGLLLVDIFLRRRRAHHTS